MKYKLFVFAILCTTLTGCTQNIIDKVNPAVNNSWGMRLSADGIVEESLTANSSGPDDTMSRGDSNEPNKVNGSTEKDVISSTLTKDILDELGKIDANIESASKVPIVNPNQVHAAAYIEKYLNPKITKTLNVLKTNTSTKNYPTLYFKVAYRGLDMMEDGTQKWVTYSKSMQNMSESSNILSDSASVILQLANWENIQDTLKDSYTYEHSKAVEFGKTMVNGIRGPKTLGDCTIDELIQVLGLPQNRSIKVKYINTYLKAIGSKKYHTLNSYIQSYQNNLELSYSSASTTAKHLSNILPVFSNGHVAWSPLTVKENEYDTVATLVRNRISARDMSSIFNTSQSNNKLKTEEIKYSNYSKYDGRVFYFENGNHKLVIMLYGDNLWKAQNKEFEEIVRNELSDLKGPNEFTSDQLKAMQVQ